MKNNSSANYNPLFVLALNELNRVSTMLSELEEGYYGHPDEITFMDDWMASGFFAKWRGCGGHDLTLVFIYNCEGEEELWKAIPIRAELYNRTTKTSAEPIKGEGQLSMSDELVIETYRNWKTLEDTVDTRLDLDEALSVETQNTTTGE